ncbi:MAG: LPS export ABC transporter permease LptG [Alphaproteobacteria bacterium]
MIAALTSTLSRYIARTYVVNMLFLLFILLGIIYLFDTIELIRRANKRDDVPLSLVLQMGLLKLPEVGQLLFPFAVLFSAIYTFWQLTKRYELIVVRSAGFSVWQFLMPVIAVAVTFGLLQMTIINPAGALLVGKFSELENTHLNNNTSQIAFFEEGLWLRQDLNNQGDYSILHAERISQPSWKLQSVTVLKFDRFNRYTERLDAKEATLESGRWLLNDVIIHEPAKAKREEKFYALDTTLTLKEIEDSFASPETMSFWQLPHYIRTLEATGFDPTRLKIHYQNLWAQPLFFAAMVLLAATVSMRPPRFRGAFALIVLGIALGFIVFFLSSFLQALGTSGQIPVLLAAWSPALICFLLGLTALMNLEDG